MDFQNSLANDVRNSEYPDVLVGGYMQRRLLTPVPSHLYLARLHKLQMSTAIVGVFLLVPQNHYRSG